MTGCLNAGMNYRDPETEYHPFPGSGYDMLEHVFRNQAENSDESKRMMGSLMIDFHGSDGRKAC